MTGETNEINKSKFLRTLLPSLLFGIAGYVAGLIIYGFWALVGTPTMTAAQLEGTLGFLGFSIKFVETVLQ